MLARGFAFAAVSATAAMVALANVDSVPDTANVSTRPTPRHTWNPRSAEGYLDQRQLWWESWPKSVRDHGTVCISCHTAVPYALARPKLTEILREEEVPAPERKVIADVETRVREWRRVKPFYGDTTLHGRAKAIQSRGTEAVLNALILASRDRRNGLVSEEARLAFVNMFEQQKTTGDDAGAWPWLDFNLRPWESTSATYFGAALAAIAVGLEPQAYANSAEIQPNLDLLRRYLRGHMDQTLWNRIRRRDDPSLFNRAMLLWASAHLSGLLSSDERRSLVSALFEAQDHDGGWRLSSLGYWRHAAGVPPQVAGDGFATGLVTYALEESGNPPDEPHVARGLAWLASHQDTTTGAWSASSLNKHRDPSTNVGKFMSDAATAYAVLALARADVTTQAARSRPENTAVAAPHPTPRARPRR